MRKVTALFLCIFCFCGLLSAETIPVGHLRMDAFVRTEFLVNGPSYGWGVEDSGMDKVFSSPATADSRTHWKGSYGETAGLGLSFRPHERVDGEMGLVFIGDYADTLYMPVNDEHRMKLEGQYLKFASGRVAYSGDWMSFRLFRGIGHSSWEGEGDIFYLHPEQWQSDMYRRVSGRCVPQGGEVAFFGPWGRLTTLFSLGDSTELYWGKGPTYFAKYDFLLGPFDSSLIFRDEELIWSRGEHMRSFSYSTKYRFLDMFPMQTGFLYQPFRVGDRYTYVEEVPEGEGYLGSKYLKKEDSVAQKDALGFKTKISSMDIPGLSEASLTYAYQGIVAGNLNQVEGSLKRRFSRSFSGTLGYIFRRPVIGPVPYLYSGTASSPGPVYTTPRGEESPFWVTQDNRDARIASLVFTFDPTPNTVFYRYRPDIVDEQNINPKEDAPLCFALGIRFSRYPGTTDLQTYIDETGQTIWEPSTSHGLWPTQWLPEMVSYVGFNISRTMLSLALTAGDSNATGGLSYIDSDEEPRMKSVTRFIKASFGIRNARHRFLAEYGRNVWGPEDWHRHFGQTVDQMYKIMVEQYLGKYITVGAKYTGYNEKDNEYISTGLGSFNEFSVYCDLRYTGFFTFSER